MKGNNVFTQKLKRMTEDKRPFGLKLFIALSAYFVFAYFLIFAVPCEVYLGNMQDFIFPFKTLLLIMGTAAVVFIVIATALTLLLKGWFFDAVVSFFFAITIGSFIQGNYMNGILESLDGTAMEWNMHTKTALINLAIWLVIILIPLVVRIFSEKIWGDVIRIASIMLIVIQTIVLALTLIQTDFTVQTKDTYVSKAGFYDVSDENNVIVFILDYYDNRYADDIIAEEPDFFNKLEGFTRYTNCNTQYRNTMPAIPYLLTGVDWDPAQDLWSYPNYSFSRSDFLKDLSERNCKIDIYTEAMYLSDYAYEYMDNYVDQTPDIDPFGVFKAMEMCTLYREAPIVLKPFFWFYTHDLTIMSLAEDDNDLSLSAYYYDDAKFKSDICSNGLTVVDDEYDAQFKFFHLFGSHPPYSIDENGNTSETADRMSASRGSIKIVCEYLDQLKALGLYEDSTIIITSDHGINRFYIEQVAGAAENGEVYFGNSEPDGYVPTPILFVKPAGKGEGDPYTESAAPVQQSNFRATVMKAVDPDNQDYGDAFYEVDENAEITRYFYFREAYEGDPHMRTFKYEINGNARDINSWSVSDEIWDNCG